MKVAIIIEDTHTGVTLKMDAECNGVQDHPRDSLAVMHAAQVQLSLAHTVKVAHFNTHWKEPDECLPNPRNRTT